MVVFLFYHMFYHIVICMHCKRFFYSSHLRLRKNKRNKIITKQSVIPPPMPTIHQITIDFFVPDDTFINGGVGRAPVLPLLLSFGGVGITGGVGGVGLTGGVGTIGSTGRVGLTGGVGGVGITGGIGGVGSTGGVGVLLL